MSRRRSDGAKDLTPLSRRYKPHQREFKWPRQAMRDVWRHYKQTGQGEMAELMAHEIKRHERIEKKVDLEREVGG